VVAIHYEPYLSGTNLVYESQIGAWQPALSPSPGFRRCAFDAAAMGGTCAHYAVFSRWGGR
jgi:hypothetical protein